MVLVVVLRWFWLVFGGVKDGGMNVYNLCHIFGFLVAALVSGLVVGFRVGSVGSDWLVRFGSRPQSLPHSTASAVKGRKRLNPMTAPFCVAALSLSGRGAS